jgi:hypothetical protein
MVASRRTYIRRTASRIPAGAYEVEVSTPAGDLQPPSVKQQLGSDYEALTGPLW